MITGELKNKIDGLWDVFAAGGLVNPLEVIEQITYLMFIRDLDDVDNKREKESAMLGLPYQSIFEGEVKIGDRSIEGTQLKWSVFHDFPAGRMYTVMQEWVFPFIKNLHSDKNSAYSKYMDDAIFKLPTPLLLSKVVDSLDEIYEIMNSTQSSDVRGDVYEYLLNKIASAGRNGQFRTPRHIIRMMVEMVDPKADDVICDPACGTSGFLVSAAEYLKETKKEEIFFDKDAKQHYMNTMFNGFDMDRTMLRIGAMNMMTHGIDNPFIEYRDSLSDQNADHDKYSLILANPPFKGSLDADAVSGDLLKVCKTKKTELLFLALFLRMLKVGGRCACIVPDGVLFGSSKAHKDIRKQIVEENRLEAVISMPSGVFKPYAGVSTAILIFTKTGHGGTDNVWFYDMTADGYSLDDKRTPVSENDIPDIIERLKNLDKEADRKRTDKSFMVPKQEIADNDYDLSINKYKEVVYEKVEYPPTSEIMANIREIEMEIGKEMDELEKLLNIENGGMYMADKIQLYEDQPIRTAWVEDEEEWYFSIVDVVGALTEQPDYQKARKYWNKLKQRLSEEGSQLVTNCHQLKMTAQDGKKRLTDVANTEQLLRLIQSIPSKKAELFKMWLAQVGRERIEETIDPELTIDRALETYARLGYDADWINQSSQKLRIQLG